MALTLCLVNYPRPAKGEEKFRLPKWAKPPSVGVALHVVEDGSVIETLPLDDKKIKYYMFGRYPACSCSSGKPIRLKRQTLSRQHAVIVHAEDEAVYIIDLDSAHGTFIGNERVQPYTPTLLKNANTITFGDWDRKFLVRMFPMGDSLLDPGITLSRKLFAGMSVSCEDDEDSAAEDAETRLHTKLNSVVSYPSPRGKNIRKRHSFCFSSSTQYSGLERPKSMMKSSANLLSYGKSAGTVSKIDENKDYFSSSTFGGASLQQVSETNVDEPPPRPRSRRRVSFSMKCPEFIPEHFRKQRQKVRSKSMLITQREGRLRSDSLSSSSDGEMDTVVNEFDPRFDLPEDSLGRKSDKIRHENENPIAGTGRKPVSHKPKSRKVTDVPNHASFSFLDSGHENRKVGETLVLRADSFARKPVEVSKCNQNRVRPRRRSNSFSNGGHLRKQFGNSGPLTHRKSFIESSTMTHISHGLMTPRVSSGHMTPRMNSNSHGLESQGHFLWGAVSKTTSESKEIQPENVKIDLDKDTPFFSPETEIDPPVKQSTSLPLSFSSTKRQKV
mmetsp:Transcript_8928/g.10216  ORF Transcript_8928/g.10216 Transcript_8928/m.10216 type:complete len:556 (-) Transcript_8928:130-1797(-)|eukprot:CAMPEP_0184018060 /NCGR_PEP_ID=MMETSP0954-20121128/7913_1 /TAXON_ID=627963 /ORGANISM="Aplanochytrium sp, Strain PBS07" /LENGTH=555 /DNA_ID=CAMNT_0026299427 /DNA_START=445 /DNA_END=2112 /DNA_ORIENTATION=+